MYSFPTIFAVYFCYFLRFYFCVHWKSANKTSQWSKYWVVPYISAETHNYLKLMTCKSHKINVDKVLVYINFQTVHYNINIYIIYTSEHDNNQSNFWYFGVSLISILIKFLNPLLVFMVELYMVEMLCWWPEMSRSELNISNLKVVYRVKVRLNG